MPARPSPYDYRHKTLRKQWQRRMDRAWARGLEVICARPGCGRPITPFEPWDLGHADGSKTKYHGPEHAACNRATKGRPVKRFSREW